MKDSVKLIWGPYDGGKVRGEHLPEVIYTGRSPKWDSEGHVAWSSERSKKFSCCYVLEGSVYAYREVCS
jgi:hypothetical protein